MGKIKGLAALALLIVIGTTISIGVNAHEWYRRYFVYKQ